MVVFLFLFLFFILSSVLGKVRSAVGSAQLLISQKFQQFRGLCDQNLVCILPQVPVGVREKMSGAQTSDDMHNTTAHTQCISALTHWSHNITTFKNVWAYFSIVSYKMY